MAGSRAPPQEYPRTCEHNQKADNVYCNACDVPRRKLNAQARQIERAIGGETQRQACKIDERGRKADIRSVGGLIHWGVLSIRTLAGHAKTVGAFLGNATGLLEK